MAKPLTRAHALENAAFLKALRRTGNVRLAAREVGVKYGTIQHRRATHPAFAQRWDAALAFANARLLKRGGRKGPVGKKGVGDTSPCGEAPPPFAQEGERSPSPSMARGGSFRTEGGEPVVVMLKSGRLQVRRAQPGKVTRQAEQAFLLALSATANISLAAASVGVAEAAFHRRNRRNPAFAREMRAALQEGYERIELALLEGWSPESCEDDAWRHNDPPPIPPMTPSQALQLLYLHHKQVYLAGARLPARLTPGESSDLRSARMAALYRRRLAEATEDEIARKVLEREPPRGPSPHEPPPPALPDLAQVTGWSKADPAKTPHDPGRALFGGWRIEEMEGKRKRR